MYSGWHKSNTLNARFVHWPSLNFFKKKSIHAHNNNNKQLQLRSVNKQLFQWMCRVCVCSVINFFRLGFVIIQTYFNNKSTSWSTYRRNAVNPECNISVFYSIQSLKYNYWNGWSVRAIDLLGCVCVTSMCVWTFFFSCFFSLLLLSFR